ncbi:unnamed protein product [Cuscuta epithymum]|uniref:Glycine-rich protein n=1 Tax=Cuscuta epithymum TaxID=186058 RepID=A0AAV0CZG2_9ASTE|nr:unnamed protein product [Cuscuta epithymum]
MEAVAASDVIEGPVLSLITKRIRALRKKLNRISQMEDSVSKGKTLNKEQEETLRTKPSVLAGIEELEKLLQPLAAAVGEEVSLAVQRHKVSALETPVEATSNADNKDEPENVVERDNKVDSQRVMIEDLLSLLYFGSMFDVSSLQNQTQVMYSKALERGSCLSYDFMKDDDSADMLEERDLDLISVLSGLLISRPVTSSLPHKHALEKCIEHAKLWLENSDQPIEPNSNVTYSGLRLKLNKIISSQYLTAAPVMNYAAYQVPVQESIPPVDAQAQAEDTGIQYQQKEEPKASSNENETENANTVEEHHQEAEELSGSFAETVAVHPEEGLEDPKDTKEEFVPRGSYNNNNYHRGGSRGGGRRGSFNGRGGGRGRGGPSYQNGGHNQYYDEQPGNYRPRNSNYRGRGSRGGRGGGGVYYNNNNHAAYGSEGGGYYSADS